MELPAPPATAEVDLPAAPAPAELLSSPAPAVDAVEAPAEPPAPAVAETPPAPEIVVPVTPPSLLSANDAPTSTSVTAEVVRGEEPVVRQEAESRAEPSGRRGREERTRPSGTAGRIAPAASKLVAVALEQLDADLPAAAQRAGASPLLPREAGAAIERPLSLPNGSTGDADVQRIPADGVGPLPAVTPGAAPSSAQEADARLVPLSVLLRRTLVTTLLERPG